MSDRPEEKEISTQLARDAVSEAIESGKSLDENFIEATAELLHNKWLQRNRARATALDLRPYGELPEAEKEKDRIFVRAAIENYKAKA